MPGDLSQEATLTIKLEDGGTSAGPGGGAPGGGGPPSAAGGGPGSAGGGPGGGNGFDPVAAAQRRLEAEQRAKQVEEAYRKLVGPPAGFDPVAAAKARIEAEQQRKQTEDAYRKLLGVPEGATLTNYAPGMAAPPVQAEPPPKRFDATAEALKHIEATNRAREVEAEVLRLTETGLDRFNRTLQAGTKLLGGFNLGLHAVNSYVHSTIQAEAAGLAGTAEPAEIRAAQKKSIAGLVGGAMQAAGAALLFVPGGQAAGAALIAGGEGVKGLGQLSALGDDKFVATHKALLGRSQELARYGGDLATAQSAGRAAHVGRDIAEARFLEREYGKLGRQFNQYDELKQQLNALKRMKEMRDFGRDQEREMNNIRREIRDLRKELGAKADELLRAMANHRSPVREFLDGVMRPGRLGGGDGKRLQEGVLGKLRDVQAAQPVFRGL